MRSVAAILAAALVVAPLGAARPAAADTAQLVESLDTAVRGFEGGAGVWIGDPASTSPLFTARADEPIITASLYKLAILLHVESLVEQGTLTYADTIMIEDEDITEDGSFFAPWTVLTVDEALEAMITISDNGTALAFWHVLGGQAMNATLAAQGIKDFRVAETIDEDNVATPRAIGAFFSLLASGRLVSRAASDRMLARLRRQTINDRIPALLPPDVVVAHKTGNLPGLTHDAGIIYTTGGPRVVVAMTWDADAALAAEFIAGLASLVYATVLEPPTNARYSLPRLALADAASDVTVQVRVTNAGTKPWTGPDAVALIYDIVDAKGAPAGGSARPLPVASLAPGRSVAVPLVVQAPAQFGDYTLHVGLADASGAPLARRGVATGALTLRVHPPFVANAAVQMPKILHSGEASLVVVQAAVLPAGQSRSHAVGFGYRVVDRATGRVVAQGVQALGTLDPASGRTFFVAFVAPAVQGAYRVDVDLREGGQIASATSSTLVTIGDPRTYPGDETRATPYISTRTTTGATPKPRLPLPQLPLPSFTLPRGKTPAPPP